MNKKNLKHWILLLTMTICFLPGNATRHTYEINEGWQFKQVRGSQWREATVPGVVHTDLMRHGVIEDPFFRLNERGVQWIDKEDWEYRTEFDLPDSLAGRKNYRLQFNGLDTYADVYLNDSLILQADNMFRRWAVDVSALLQSQGNVLRVYFHSPIKVDLPKWKALPFEYFASNDQSENGGIFDNKLSVVARKAGYHYGWDWGPRLVTSGIWRPIVLEAWDEARIDNVQVVQSQVTAKRAHLDTYIEILSDTDITDATVTVSDQATQKTWGQTRCSLTKGVNRVAVSFDMKNPELWWCNGLGDPHLYTFDFSVNRGETRLDSCSERVGIRAIRFVNEEDAHGKCYYFELNGEPLFIKGANYIPSDNFLPRVSHADYEKTIQDAVDVHMNMLRVWGGGVYEDDYFYDLCDENGILVFQDFMFACSIYPAEGALLESIRQEAIDNVRRLRNHPSIALWCGNNECQQAWLGWGWKRYFSRELPEAVEIIERQMYDQYHRVLPEVVAEHGSGISYVPSSPYPGYNKLNNSTEGDLHYWEVWHGEKPIAEYNKVRSRFFSEYGFQSFPELETVKLYAPDSADWSISSEVIMAHQRGGDHANALINSYLLSEYYEPKDFPSFLYISQLLQGDAIKTAIEAHRRDKGYCMGTLFWQHNDCWPVASWSSRDYYGRWKAQHYFTREVYRDILVSPIEQEGQLNVYLVSDRLSRCSGHLTVQVIKFDGTVVSSVEKRVTIPANSSLKAFSKDLETMTQGVEKSDLFVRARFTADGESYTNNYFLLKQREMNYPAVTIAHEVSEVEGGIELTLTADRFARGVFLSIEGIDNFFGNNYFDLLPNEPFRLFVRCSLDKETFEKQLRICSLSDMR